MRNLLRRFRMWLSMESTVVDDIMYQVSRIKKWLKENNQALNREHIADEIATLNETLLEMQELIVELIEEKKHEKKVA